MEYNNNNRHILVFYTYYFMVESSSLFYYTYTCSKIFYIIIKPDLKKKECDISCYY